MFKFLRQLGRLVKLAVYLILNFDASRIMQVMRNLARSSNKASVDERLSQKIYIKIISEEISAHKKKFVESVEIQKAVFILGPQPSEETGIANFNMRLCSELSAQNFVYVSDSNTPLFEQKDGVNLISLLFFRELLNDFALVDLIISLGNSDHFKFYRKFILEMFDSVSGSVAVYIHDTVIDNTDVNLHELALLCARYPKRFLIFNSDHARKLCLGDLVCPHVVLFHPVFRPHEATNFIIPQLDTTTLKIGVFGYIGGHKCIEEFLVAVKKFNRPVIIVFAGYNVITWLAYRKLVSTSKLKVLGCQPRSSGELMAVMSKVDVAVQLRKGSTGESSGVLSQLFTLRVPCVISDVPQNSVYEDGAVMIQNDRLNSDLEACCERAIERLGDPNEIRSKLSSHEWMVKYLDYVSCHAAKVPEDLEIRLIEC